MIVGSRSLVSKAICLSIVALIAGCGWMFDSETDGSSTAETGSTDSSYIISGSGSLKVSTRFDCSSSFKPCLRVQSLVDQIQIYDVRVNRGNCHSVVVSTAGGSRTHLRYGESVDVMLIPHCDPVEVRVGTSMGVFNYEF